MTNTEHTTMQPQLIAVSRLEKSPLNARRIADNVGMEKLKSWLPAGMAFGPVPIPKPAKTRKSRKAA